MNTALSHWEKTSAFALPPSWPVATGNNTCPHAKSRKAMASKTSWADQPFLQQSSNPLCPLNVIFLTLLYSFLFPATINPVFTGWNLNHQWIQVLLEDLKNPPMAEIEQYVLQNNKTACGTCTTSLSEILKIMSLDPLNSNTRTWF